MCEVNNFISNCVAGNFNEAKKIYDANSFDTHVINNLMCCASNIRTIEFLASLGADLSKYHNIIVAKACESGNIDIIEWLTIFNFPNFKEHVMNFA